VTVVFITPKKTSISKSKSFYNWRCDRCGCIRRESSWPQSSLYNMHIFWNTNLQSIFHITSTVHTALCQSRLCKADHHASVVDITARVTLQVTVGRSVSQSGRQTDRQTVSQSGCPSWRWAPLGLMTRFWLWSRQLLFCFSWGFLSVERTYLSCNSSQSLSVSISLYVCAF
jgi:hypothetical protein